MIYPTLVQKPLEMKEPLDAQLMYWLGVYCISFDTKGRRMWEIKIKQIKRWFVEQTSSLVTRIALLVAQMPNNAIEKESSEACERLILNCAQLNFIQVRGICLH